MKALRNYLDKIKPNFEEGGKFHAFQSVSYTHLELKIVDYMFGIAAHLLFQFV